MTSPNVANQTFVPTSRNDINHETKDLQQTQRLLRLEEKYGNKRLRIESAHAQAMPAPKTRASRFHQYVGWLGQNAKVKTARAKSPPPTPQAVDQAIEIASNLKFASPDILATVTPVRKPADDKNAFAIPTDNAAQSLERLTRVDGPAKAKRGISKKPNFAKRKNAIRVTTTWKPDETVNKHGIARPYVAPPVKQKPATVPTSQVSSQLVAWEVDDFVWPKIVKEAFNDTETAINVAAAVEQAISAGNQRLGIAGSGRGPGATTIAAYVARILAAKNKSVLLVDADLAKPDLTQRLCIPDELSWSNVVALQSKCSDSIVRSCANGVCLMPLAKMNNRVAYPDFLYDCLGGIIDGVKRNFDHVIIDMGPTSQMIRELRRPNILADAVMLVHNVRTPDRSTYIRNQTELNSFGVKNIVVAENFTARKSA